MPALETTGTALGTTRRSTGCQMDVVTTPGSDATDDWITPPPTFSRT